MANEVHVHPLLFPSVIRSVLQCLPLGEATNCRDVCRAWSVEADRLIEERTVVTFLDNQDIKDHLMLIKTHNYPKSTYQMYDGVPFVQSNSILCQFLAECGANVRTLILQQSAPPVQERDLLWALAHLPRLEELTLRCVPLRPEGASMDNNDDPPPVCIHPSVKHLTIGTKSFDTSTHRAAGAGFARPLRLPQQMRLRQRGRGVRIETQHKLVRLLSSFPNLESINLSQLDDPQNSPNAQRAGTELIAAYAEMPVPLGRGDRTLALNFLVHLSPSRHVPRLSSRRISAIKLELHEEQVLVPVAQILQSLAPTLTSLHLAFGSEITRLAGIIPAHDWLRLPRLQNLTLLGYRWPLDFLRYLTNLEALTCGLMSPFFCDLFRVQDGDERPLHTLKLHGSSGAMCGAELVARIGEAFPNLRVLHLPCVDDNALRAIYLHIPHLTELTCTESSMTDWGVTGIRRQVCLDMAIEMSAVLITFNGASHGAKYRTDLFIGNLYNLRKLRLESPALTSLSVLFGVVAGSGLQYIELASEQIDDTAVQGMAEQICRGWSPKRLTLVQCPLVTQEAKTFVLERAGAHRLKVDVYVPGDAVGGPQDAEWEREVALHHARDRESLARLWTRPNVAAIRP